MVAPTVAAQDGAKQDPNPVQTGLAGYVQAGELLEEQVHLLHIVLGQIRSRNALSLEL